MDGSKRTLFLAVSLFVFLAALGVSSARLAARYTDNLRKAQTVFQSYRSAAAQAMARSGPGDETWRKAARDLYRSDDSVLLVALHAPGQGVLYMVPRSTPYLANLPQSPIAPPELLYPPQTVTRLSAVVGSNAGIPVTLDILYSLLRQRDVYEAARIGLLIAAGWTALSLLIVTIAGLRSAPIARASTAAAKPSQPDAMPVFRSLESGNRLLDEDFALPEIPLEPEPPSSSDSSFPLIENRATGGEPGKGPDVGHPAAPKGLYAPESGLGWAEYLPERLGAELSRAASFEQDLVLLELSHEGIPRKSPSYRVIIRILLEFFNFRDLAFEQGPTGLAVILPNIDSDHALRMAEEYLKKITSILREEGDSQDHLKIFLGLSSRSGRLVDADRVIREARAALERAREEEDSRILAFKPDPNKYRAFVAERG